MLDKTPKPLNDEAKKLAKEFKDVTGTTEFLAQTAVQVMTVKREVEQELRQQSQVLRDIARKGDERLTKVREEAAAKLNKIDEMHTKYIAALRAAQPELEYYEFRINVEDMTYTLVSEREIVVDDEKPKEDVKVDEDPTMASVKEMVENLLSKVMKGPPA